MFIRAFTELIQFINPGANNSCFCHVSFLPGQWVESVSLGAWRALDLLPARGTRQPEAGERRNKMRMGHRMFGALNDSCRWWRSAHYSFLCLPIANSFRTSFIDQTFYRLQPAWKKQVCVEWVTKDILKRHKVCHILNPKAPSLSTLIAYHLYLLGYSCSLPAFYTTSSYLPAFLCTETLPEYLYSLFLLQTL